MKLLFALVLALPFVQDSKPVVPKLPTPEERLDASPRHHEWIDVKSGEKKVRAFVAFPEVKSKVGVVIVIHENKGLTTWARSVADQLAEAGWIAIAPDLLSGKGPNGGHTEAFDSTDAATKAIYALDAKEVLADLNAVCEHAKTLEAANGKLAVAGYCWGGTQSFAFAAERKDLTAALVFYGGAPKDEAAFARIGCTVHGFYGENDSRINSGIDATKESMKKAGKTFEPVIYAGAGHGFFRAGESAEPDSANRKARDEAWKRVTGILGEALGPKPAAK